MCHPVTAHHSSAESWCGAETEHEVTHSLTPVGPGQDPVGDDRCSFTLLLAELQTLKAFNNYILWIHWWILNIATGLCLAETKGVRRQIETDSRCWWCWSWSFLIYFDMPVGVVWRKIIGNIWKSAVPTRDADCKDVCSPPVGWGSLDSNNGATPPFLLALPPTSSPLLQVCSSCGSSWPWVSICVNSSEPYRQLRMQLIASFGGSWACLDSNTGRREWKNWCQKECQNRCQAIRMPERMLEKSERVSEHIRTLCNGKIDWIRWDEMRSDQIID